MSDELIIDVLRARLKEISVDDEIDFLHLSTEMFKRIAEVFIAEKGGKR